MPDLQIFYQNFCSPMTPASEKIRSKRRWYERERKNSKKGEKMKGWISQKKKKWVCIERSVKRIPRERRGEE